MKEACQPSFHISLSFVLFYFAAPHDPAHSSCPAKKLKYGLELSSKGGNTETDLALQLGPRCCTPCNIVSLNLFTLRSRSWTAFIAAGFEGNGKDSKYSARRDLCTIHS